MRSPTKAKRRKGDGREPTQRGDRPPRDRRCASNSGSRQLLRHRRGGRCEPPAAAGLCSGRRGALVPAAKYASVADDPRAAAQQRQPLHVAEQRQKGSSGGDSSGDARAREAWAAVPGVGLAAAD
jgi:hypothetical protein